MTPVKSAQKRRPDSDIDLSNLSPATKASKIDAASAPTEKRKSTRNLYVSSESQSNREKNGVPSDVSKNPETKDTTVATSVENVTPVDEKDST